MLQSTVHIVIENWPWVFIVQGYKLFVTLIHVVLKNKLFTTSNGTAGIFWKVS